ncbi:MAG: hypothetical protein GY847_25985 [Proteobacteria bacterium]|nr:hypothetical protein [Pseudomonadota bacterium]
MDRARVSELPVDFAFEVNAKLHNLSDLRGRPLVLVFMRTSEIPSQIYIKEIVKAFYKVAGRVQFLALTIEPSETPFVALYAESEELPFPIGVAEQDVAKGKSSLGRIRIVPSTYFVNSSGKVFQMVAGMISVDDIVQVVQALDER